MTNAQELIKQLTDDDVNVRKNAADGLAEIKDDETIIEPLINALSDENSQVRFKSSQALGNVGEIAVDPLIEAAKSEEDGEVKRYILEAIKKIGSLKSVDYFIEALDDDDWGVKKVAARALGELGDLKALEPLQKALDDDDWGVRLAGIYSLGDLASEESIAMIKKARRKEKDKDFKKACNKAIKKAEKTMKNK